MEPSRMQRGRFNSKASEETRVSQCLPCTLKALPTRCLLYRGRKRQELHSCTTTDGTAAATAGWAVQKQGGCSGNTALLRVETPTVAVSCSSNPVTNWGAGRMITVCCGRYALQVLTSSAPLNSKCNALGVRRSKLLKGMVLAACAHKCLLHFFIIILHTAEL